MKTIGQIVLLLIAGCIFIPLGLVLIFWVYSLNSINETSRPEYLKQISERYSKYADVKDIEDLKWATGMFTGCVYTRVSWSGASTFELSETVDQRGRNGLQLDLKKIWYPTSGSWERGPIDRRKPSAYHSGQVSNCNTSKFGRVPNAYKKIFTEDVWFIDTRQSVIVISNKDKTIERLSEVN